MVRKARLQVQIFSKLVVLVSETPNINRLRLNNNKAYNALMTLLCSLSTDKTQTDRHMDKQMDGHYHYFAVDN